MLIKHCDGQWSILIENWFPFIVLLHPNMLIFLPILPIKRIKAFYCIPFTLDIVDELQLCVLLPCRFSSLSRLLCSGQYLGPFTDISGRRFHYDLTNLIHVRSVYLYVCVCENLFVSQSWGKNKKQTDIDNTGLLYVELNWCHFLSPSQQIPSGKSPFWSTRFLSVITVGRCLWVCWSFDN